MADEQKPTIESLLSALTDVQGKLAAAQKQIDRWNDLEAREEARKRRDAELSIAIGRELMDERIAADTDPRWLKFREVTERAVGAGWFEALFDRHSTASKRSPAAWLEAISKAIKIRDALAIERREGYPRGDGIMALEQVIGEWLERIAAPGLKAACGTGEF